MQDVYMCMEEICQASSRFNVSKRELVKGGIHYGHDCQDLKDIRDNIQFLIQFWITNTVGALHTDLDKKCDTIKKACALSIDQYCAQQKQMIQSNMQSFDEFGSRQLIKAVHERDLGFLEEHQNHYQILMKPQLILNKEQEMFDIMKNDIAQRCDQMDKRLTQMFSNLVHDNLDDHQVQDQMSRAIIENLQKELNQREDFIKDLLIQQEEQVKEPDLMLSTMKLQEEKIRIMAIANINEDNSNHNESQKEDYLFKILLIGAQEVGKSSIMMRFSDNSFSDDYLPSIGVDFKIHNLDLQGKLVQLRIWDAAGQERFKTIVLPFYKIAHGIILTYDITNKSTFEQMKDLLKEVENHANENVIRLLVGNKSDLETERQVTFEEGQALAYSLGIKFAECSAKSNTNLDEIFMMLAENIMAKTNNIGSRMK